MGPAEILAFLGVALLASMSPGVDTALVTKNALSRGSAAAVLTALGCSIGQLCWGAASALGVSAILSASATAFTVVKLVGAAYLIYLGLQSIVRAGRGSPSAEGSAVLRGGRPSRSGFFEGLTTNLLNPKTALFFSSLLPQFVSPGDPAVLFAVLTAATALVSFSWLSLYTLILGRLGEVLRRPRVRGWFDRIMGSVLVALGVRVALERR